MGDVALLVDELRRRGLTVHEWADWDGRGNEGIEQITIKGAVLHHTASGYGSAFQTLVTGRPDLRGTLCNFAGNSDGTLTVISSGLAWHAGAGAGPDLGPLAAYRGWMNRWTVGLEIVYPGDQPMTDAQRAAALVFARTVADLFCGGDVEYVRAHAETNGQGGDGKWDPGYAPGRTIDMDAFRAAAAALGKEIDVLTPNDGNVRWAAANPYAQGSVETHPVATWIGVAAFHGLEAVRLNRIILATVTQIANDPDVTAAEIEAAIKRSDAENAPIVAELVATRIGSSIGDLVEEALERVQQGDSDADVTALLQRIATLLPS